MLMPLSRNWRRHPYILAHATGLNIRMRCSGRDGQEEGFGQLNSLIQKPVCFLRQHIRGIFALMTDWGLVISLEGGIQVIVGMRIEEKVRASPPSGTGRVPVVDRVGIEELAGVVGAIASVL